LDTNRLLIAFDFPDRTPAQLLLSKLDPAQCRIKIGKEMFTRFGPAWVEEVQKAGFQVFLDLKFHDIPNTVQAACRAACDLGVWMVNVHALGGARMLAAAREAVPPTTKLIAVTMLTSLASGDLPAIGMTLSIEEMVARLATLSREHGLDGVVCSAQEATLLRAQQGPNFKLICPGIHWGPSVATDQQRVMSPTAALAAGADYLVIGRAITRAVDPMQTLAEIAKSCQ